MQTFKLLTSNHQTNQIFAQSLQKVPKAIQNLLEECYAVISDLKQKCKMLQNQIGQKQTIIDKLLQQKQNHLLHLSHCQAGKLKQQLDQANQHAVETKHHFESILINLQKSVERYRIDFQKLKGFNKVLRIENNHLREQINQHQLNWRQREKKIGKITQFKLIQEDQVKPINKFFYIKNNFHQIEQQQTNQQITPIKFKTFKFNNLSTDTKSYSKHYSKELTRRQGLKPRQLFHNTVLKQQIKTTNCQDKKYSSQEEIVSVWFSKLKKLLTESDQDN